MMLGTYRHNVDAKGRLFVPAKLKEELGEAFYVTISVDPCLTIYTAEKLQKLMDRVDEMPMLKARRLRGLFANVVKCEPDKQGRFLLPAELRQRVGITQEVTIIGQGSYAEIWDSKTYEAVDAECTNPENLAAAMEEAEF